MSVREHQQRISIGLPKELIAALVEAGTGIAPCQDLWKGETQLVGFSDYKLDGSYSMSTLYVMTTRDWEALCARLQAVREQFSVSSRVLEYKKRNKWQRHWPQAINPWMETIMDVPGIAVSVAISKEILSDFGYRELLTKATKSLRESGTNLNGRMLANAAIQLAPFLIIAPVLPKVGALAWYSDHDALTSGGMSQRFMDLAVENLELGGSSISLGCPCYPQSIRLPEEVQLGLSFPDIVCGVLPEWLSARDVASNSRNTTLDESGFQLLAAVAQLSSASSANSRGGRLHISVVDKTACGWIHRPVSMKVSSDSP